MKVSDWTRIRKKVKTQFEKRGITRCQMCGRADYLSFAHRLKRRFITTDEELAIVALLCMDNPEARGCHNKLEHGPKQVMFETITKLNLRVGENIYEQK